MSKALIQMLALVWGVTQWRAHAYHVPGPGFQPQHQNNNNNIKRNKAEWDSSVSHVATPMRLQL
jgi:hypothetical protein